MIDINILEKLNAKDKAERLKNLEAAVNDSSFPDMVDQYVNNHIHTTYSFSPYSPTAAVYAARAEGLCTAGIIDHDSIRGAREFLEAAKIIDMPVTVGMECRTNVRGTPLEKLRLNNPDQIGVAYMTIQAVPHSNIEEMDAFFVPYRAKREERNKRMVSRINELLSDINLDYERDIRALSMAHDGGSVTERHLMYGLAKAMVRHAGKGEGLVKYLENIGVALSEKQKSMLVDISYNFYEYDLLGILKSAFVPKIFIPAEDELPALADVVALCDRLDAILCYAYLGDVGESITGDKAAQKFEDDHLELVIDVMKQTGVRALTYMPTRNTKAQLDRVRALCVANDLFQVSGEDVNSPRQSFVINALKDPDFANLIESTWKLIEHENR